MQSAADLGQTVIGYTCPSTQSEADLGQTVAGYTRAEARFT